MFNVVHMFVGFVFDPKPTHIPTPATTLFSYPEATYFSPATISCPTLLLPHTNTLTTMTKKVSNIAAPITRRAKLYTRTALDSAASAFLSYFQLDVPFDGTNAPKAFSSTRVDISIASITSVELALSNKHHQAVRGIHFDFGVKSKAFHPVVQFMYADPNAKGDLVLFNERYEVVNELLVEITVAEADTITERYKDQIRIDRKGDSTFTGFKLDGTEPDPKAEWFPYADNVNKLRQDNSAGLYLVVRCITEDLVYSGMAFTDVDNSKAVVGEYRHLLALHLSTGSRDLVENYEPTLTSGYRDLAMDLGFLCPPRCKK